MEQLIASLKNQPVFILILAFLAALIAYSIIKKLLKVLAVLSLILVAYLAFLVWKGETVTFSKKHIEKYRKEKVEELKKGGADGVVKFLNRAGKVQKALKE